jgi:SAM-dependent methyltransferase
MSETTKLLAWEQAEIARSSSAAAKAAAAIRPTSASILKRYAVTAGDTPYPLEYAFHLLGDAAGRYVLDLGCGTGANSAVLAAAGARVASMDISPDLLALAARRLALDGLDRRVTTMCGSAHAIPLPAASMDLVLGISILHHLDLALTAREVHRVLKPGGRAVFMEPIRNSRSLTFLRRLIPYRAADVSPFERPLRNGDIEAFALPFIPRRARPFRLPFVTLARIVGGGHAAVRLFDWDRTLLRRWPRLQHFATVQVFELQKAS